LQEGEADLQQVLFRDTVRMSMSAAAVAAAAAATAVRVAAFGCAGGDTDGGSGEFAGGVFAAALRAVDFLIARLDGGHVIEIGFAGVAVILVDGHRGLQEKVGAL
jgi:hypothetical protein